jgi:heterodisulfide reductase subunit A
LNERKAIAFAFMGGLPHAPFIDPAVCIRFKDNQPCALCQTSCPIPGAIALDDQPQELERKVGAIVVAIGGALYDCTRLPNLGFGHVPGVVHALQFERLASANGPTEGHVLAPSGAPAKRVAIIHCAGSLDSNHRKYCSAVCCSYAFKFGHLIRKKSPGAKVTHYFKCLCVPGKEGYQLYDHAQHDPDTRLVHYSGIDRLSVRAGPDGGAIVECAGSALERDAWPCDLVVLCPPIVPGADTAKLGQLLGVTTDAEAFFEELHGLVDSTKAKVRGIYLAGTCQAPMDIPQAVNQGVAAGGDILGALVAGRKLEIEPVVASVDAERCAGCMCCVPLCPYKAITRNKEKDVAEINAVLCQGCGTCVASCPCGAIKGSHFTNAQILAEVKGMLP